MSKRAAARYFLDVLMGRDLRSDELADNIVVGINELADQRDALLAENQQLRDALKEIASLAGEPIFEDELQDIARTALDGTPSATQTLEDAHPTERAEAS